MLPNERTTRDEVAAAPGVVDGLIVAPDRESARPSVEFLRSEGLNVQVVNSVDTGFEEALLHRPNIVLIDGRISKAGGVDLCERLKGNTRTHFLPVVLFTPQSKQAEVLRLDALAAGADAIFSQSTSKEERRARLWALLRSQAIFRKLDGKRVAQGNTISSKRRWVRGLVHDVQNALGAIQANFEYVVQQAQAHERKGHADLDECLTDTRATFRELVRSLRTVLEFERFESGDVSLKEENFLLAGICETAAASLGPLASHEGKEIVVESSSYAQPVHGDANYVKEAVVNLANYVLRQPENHTCVLSVTSDRGVARLKIFGDRAIIPDVARASLFDPYVGHSKEKATRAVHRVALALAKVIVEVHHGTIVIEDMPAAGTAFVLDFPSHWSARGRRSSE
jgi:K+-sensing histidine kinase KdpD